MPIIIDEILYYTSKELSEKFNVCMETVKWWRKHKYLKGILISPRKYLFSENDVLNFQKIPPKRVENTKNLSMFLNENLKLKNIEIIGNYTNSKIRVKLKCLKETCKYEWTTCVTKPKLKIIKCPKCCGMLKLTNEKIDEKLKPRNIQRLDDYKTIDTITNFKCLNDNCNNVWKTTIYHVINRNHGCPKCSLGKSEKHIKFLIEQHIKYDYFEPHKLFKFNNRKYTPDFYLELHDKKVIIEYNGAQHYKPVRFNGISSEKADKNFKNQQIRDTELRNFCTENSIIFLEIPYHWNELKIIEELTKL